MTLQRILICLGAVGLIIFVLGCRDPEFRLIRDLDAPESWAYNSFYDDAIFVVQGGQPNSYGRSLVSRCIPDISVQNLPGYNPSKFTKTLIRTCERFDQIYDKYGYVELSGFDYFTEHNDDLFIESWSNEIGAAVKTLRHELICGEGKEWFYDGQENCRKVDTEPILIATFPEAIDAVQEYLEDSNRWLETGCNITKCKSEDAKSDQMEADEVRYAVENGEWELYQPEFQKRGEWEVLLRFRKGGSGQYQTERFRVLNQLGTWLRGGTELAVNYPFVINCGPISETQAGSFARSADRYALHTIRMDIELDYTSNSDPCRWGSSHDGLR